MRKIIDATHQHKQQQLLYFNMLKKYVYQLNNIDEISRVVYGMKPER